tara:strand:- start:148 stop:636 length:489 start_codon:yes stop_codon:yes gene_type:complete
MGALTVSIKEELTLNGTQQGGINTVTIASVTQSFKRVVTLPANGGSGNTQTTVAVFRDVVTTADGAVDDGDAKYVRVTNLDADNSVTLSLQLAANGTADASTTSSILLKPGYSFMLCSTDNAIAVDDDAATPITSGSLVHLESILAINQTNDTTQLEVFIAS